MKTTVGTTKKGSTKPQREESISLEELKRRTGFCGGTNTLLNAFLKAFMEGYFHSQPPQTLTGLAQFLYDKKMLYTHRQGNYRLMKLSSINSLLRTLKAEIEQAKKDEKNETDRKGGRGGKTASANK